MKMSKSKFKLSKVHVNPKRKRLIKIINRNTGKKRINL
jgi:hypothetical protein